jgi:micrococcal nuclease
VLIRIQPARSRRARASVALVLSVLLSLGTGCGRGSPSSLSSPSSLDPSDDGANATIVRIVDGDTVVVALAGNDVHEEKVRLIGIDTPETKKPNTPVQCFGEQASARLHDLLPDATPVRLERDTEERDHYGRLLAYLYRTADGLFVNLSLAADGYAVPLTVAPNVTHADEFRSAAQDARRHGRGLWSACPEQRPPI